MEGEERMYSLENIGRKMKEENRMVMVIIILIMMNTHNDPWILNSYSGLGLI